MKRVLLARGGALPMGNGLGRAHYTLRKLLSNGLVSGWEESNNLEYSLTRNPFSRMKNRWHSHPKKILKYVNEGSSSILHITDQEQSHLVPDFSPIPTIVTVHDLFHFRPSVIGTGESKVYVGNHNPSMLRKRDLMKLEKGLERADFIICISDMTRQVITNMFPKKSSAVLRHYINVDYWDPNVNPQSRKQLHKIDVPKKCFLLTVSSNDDRKRLSFLDKVITTLPDEVRSELNLVHIGTGVRLDENQLIAAFQHSEAFLFPSVAEGFGRPPIEALASGCPVLAADCPAHNEMIPQSCLLNPWDLGAWVEAILEVYNTWKKRDKNESRTIMNDYINHVRDLLSAKKQGMKLAQIYDLVEEKFQK